MRRIVHSLGFGIWNFGFGICFLIFDFRLLTPTTLFSQRPQRNNTNAKTVFSL